MNRRAIGIVIAVFLIAAAAFVACFSVIACVGPANAPSASDFFWCGQNKCRVRDEECSTSVPKRCIPSWTGARHDAGGGE